MRTILIGVGLPVLLLGTMVVMVDSLSLSSALTNGIKVGLIIALIQSLISAGALRWALHRPIFIWVWGGSFFSRLLVFGATAYVALNHPQLSFSGTLLSLAVGTTLFLVFESLIFLRQK